MPSDDLLLSTRPALRRPVLILAFRGWNDGGEGASLAAGYLARLWDAERFAEIDGDGFIDFQCTRPIVTIEGSERRIEWPENAFYHAPIPGLDRDAIILLGVEPNYRWRAFADIVVELALDLGVERVVSLGALLADVPHTRPAPVTGAVSDPELAERIGLQLSRYEGPTGIIGVLHTACHRAGLESISLWAAVPHYVSLAPSPRAALALVERLGTVLGTEIDVSELADAEEAYCEQVSAAVPEDAATAAYIQELEQRADTLDEMTDSGELPSGDAIAAELTRFLREREQRTDDEGPHSPER
jgi:proteasome assembly chaperone (PAC2) family protein